MSETPSAVEQAGAARPGREAEWGRRFAALTLAWLAAETLTGLAVWLLPFSVPAQWLVVVHSGVGVLFLLPVVVYLWQHFVAYRTRSLDAVVWMGYFATAATLVAILSGLVLAVQAIWGTRISYAWDQVHLASTFALVAFALPHVLVVALRDRAAALRLGLEALRASETRMLRRAAAGGGLMLAPIAVLWAVYPGQRMNDALPADYSYLLGRERPFAPSLATTATGGAYDSRRLAGSESCGTHGLPRADRRGVARERPPLGGDGPRLPAHPGGDGEAERRRNRRATAAAATTRSRSSRGRRTSSSENLTGLAGYQEGVSCLACHSIRQTDVKGNASFVVAQPSRYLFEERRRAAGRASPATS